MSSPVAFKNQLEQELFTIVNTVASSGVDPVNYVRSTDDHIRDFDVHTENPLVAVVVRQMEADASNIGAKHGPHHWEVHIYYLGISITTWQDGKTMRDNIVERIWKYLEANPLLGSFSVTDVDGSIEYVYSSQMQGVTFDESGEDSYYSFVSEIHLQYDTETS